MLNNLTHAYELAFCSDAIYKLNLNGYQMTVMGVVEKQHKFHLAGFVFHYHGDEATFHWGHENLKEEVSEKCGVALTPWRSMNDCCVSIFNSLDIVFPMTRLGQCYFHMLKQVKKILWKTSCEERKPMFHIK